MAKNKTNHQSRRIFRSAKRLQLKNYDLSNLDLVEAPSELGLPPHSTIIMRSRKHPGGSVPFGSFLDYSTEYPSAKDLTRALNRLSKECERYDYVIMDSDELIDLRQQARENIARLPAPFFHEPLEGFTLKATYGTEVSITIDTDFMPSCLPDYYVGSKLFFLPKVDFRINFQDKEIAGCVGLASDSPQNLYRASILFFSYITQEEANVTFAIIWGYFAVQHSFMFCPERIIELKNPPLSNDPSTVAESNTNSVAKSQKLNVAPIRRTIYIGKIKTNSSNREFVRHTECWYQRGCEVHMKNGTTYFRKGCYKGPKKDDPEARRRTKKYVTDQD